MARPNPTARLGFWSALVWAGSSVAFCAASILIVLHRLRPPWDAIASLAPSLLLAPAFLVLLVCIHGVTSPEQKIWSALAVAFGGVYVPLVSAAYVVELLVVEPRVMGGHADQIALLTLSSMGSVFNAIDGLGYCFMCLSTLFLALAFSGDKLQRWIRTLLMANAVLVAPIVLTYFVDRTFIYLASLWGLTLPGSTLLLAVFFRRSHGCSDGSNPADRHEQPR